MAAERDLDHSRTYIMGRFAVSARPSLDQIPNLVETAKGYIKHERETPEAVVRCIAHDRKLSVPEGELLRTVCAVLHCPLSPILGQTGPGHAGQELVS